MAASCSGGSVAVAPTVSPAARIAASAVTTT